MKERSWALLMFALTLFCAAFGLGGLYLTTWAASLNNVWWKESTMCCGVLMVLLGGVCSLCFFATFVTVNYEVIQKQERDQ